MMFSTQLDGQILNKQLYKFLKMGTHQQAEFSTWDAAQGEVEVI